MSKNKINRQQLLLEFISVVFAVLLALFLNGWRENYNTQKALEKVKETIRQETIRNDTLIESSLTYRISLLNELYTNSHLVMKAPVSDIPVDVNKDEQLASFFKAAFGAYDKNVEVAQTFENRVLVLGEDVFDIVVDNDSIALYGIANIQLRSADISNRSWDIAQATGTLVEMDIALVEQLSKVNMLVGNYLNTSAGGLSMIYEGKMKGIIPVLEDMRNFEAEILKQDSVLLEMLYK